MDGKSLNLTQELLQQLQTLIPQAFSEGKLDTTALKTLLGEDVFVQGERYGLSWAGKSEAYKVLQQQTTTTLIPEPEQSVDWDNAQHVFIEGENLEVLKLLQKSYFGQVKMIYIDPPYNTGSDSFIYPDKFSETKEEYLQRIGDKNDEGYMLRQGAFRPNRKESGQYHSNWLNMMLPRLHLAWNLLREDGVIFISIDDHEVANLKLLMDNLFGESNFVCQFVREAIKGGSQSKHVRETHDYVLVYAKQLDELEFLGFEKEALNLNLEDEHGAYAKGRELNKWGAGSRREDSPSMWYPIPGPDNCEVYPIRNDGSEGRWRLGKKKLFELIAQNGVIFERRENGTYVAYEKLRGNKNQHSQFITILKDKYVNAKATEELKMLFERERAIFDFSKPKELIKDFMLLANISDDDIILDFFSGSGTTAQAVLEVNENGVGCHYICVQLPELVAEKDEAAKENFQTIAELTVARIKKVIAKIEVERAAKTNLLNDNKPLPHLGFRKFTLAPSNFKLWRGDVIESEEELLRQMRLFASPQRATATTPHMAWELLLKSGLSLTDKVVVLELDDGLKVYHTADKSLALVLDGFNAAVQTAVLTLKPKQLIVLDSVFAGQANGDSLKTNAQLTFEDQGIAFKTV
jgi:adenine-specific DNA-methyltransferase